MKKILKIGLFLLMVFLVGCEEDIIEEETVIIEFDTTYEKHIDAVEIVKGETLDVLPELLREGHYFLGWYHDEELFDKEKRIEEDMILVARFEDYMDVYEYEINEEQVRILKYNGELTELVIPEIIDGYNVYSIAEQAFMGSNIGRIEIPVSVIHIGFDAFRDTKELKELSYYGTYQGEIEAPVSNDEYDEWIEEYSDVCEKEVDPEYPDDENKWMFSEGCPIKKVTGQTDSVIIGDEERFTYFVIMDLAYYESFSYYNKIGFNVFFGSSIETIHLPSRYYVYNSLHFEGASELREIYIDQDNRLLKSIDGIIFNKDGDELYYYPAAKLGKTYLVDAEVELKFSALAYAKHLEMIEVEEGHPLYKSIDGVIYDSEMKTIIRYPSGKIASGFQVPEGIETIGQKAFYGSTLLEHIVLPNSVVTISEYAFESSSLTSLRIPSSVQHIGGRIFKDVETLQDVVFEGSISDNTLPIFLSSPFYIDFEDNIYENVKIFVPDDSLEVYKQIDELKHMKDNIYPLSQRE